MCHLKGASPANKYISYEIIKWIFDLTIDVGPGREGGTLGTVPDWSSGRDGPADWSLPFSSAATKITLLRYLIGQTPAAGHHAHCHREARLHPVPSAGAVPGPAQPQGREDHEAAPLPRLQQELPPPLRPGSQIEEVLQPHVCR